MSLFDLAQHCKQLKAERDQALALRAQHSVHDAAVIVRESLRNLEDDLTMALMDYTQRTGLPITHIDVRTDGHLYHLNLRTRLPS